jgi:hypothetical protein
MEIDKRTLIALIIVVISLVIIIWFFWSRLQPTNASKDACHQSIIERSTLRWKFLQRATDLPLNCQAEKICMQSGSKGCELFETAKAEYTKAKVKTEEEIYKTIADAIWDCNSMVGEGKINFMANPWNDNEHYCLICSKIIFNEEIRKEFPKLNYSKLYNYMSKNKPSLFNDKTYLEYVAGTNDPDLLFKLWGIKVDATIDTSQTYLIQIAISPEGYWRAAVAGIGVGVGTVIFGAATLGTGFIITPMIVSSGVLLGSGTLTEVFPGAGKFVYSSPKLISENDFRNLHQTDENGKDNGKTFCDTIETEP